MSETSVDLTDLQFPSKGFTCQIFGQSGVGKSFAMHNIILNEKWTFARPPAHYYYVMKFEEEKFEKIKKALGNRISFHPDFEGLAFFDRLGLSKRNESSELICLILDDMDFELFSKAENAKIADQYAHHLNVSRILFYY